MTDAAERVVAVDEFVELVRRRVAGRRRFLLGLVGPPGAGKSTLAERLRRELGAVVAPMDGFHRANAELDRLGLRDRKGAPATFDASAFVDRLTEVAAGEADVAWPAFDRELDEPVPDAIVVPSAAPLVVVEGNYLLLDESPWRHIAALCDAVAFLDLGRDDRVRRLVDRHVAHGRAIDDATDFVHRSDMANAAVVEVTRERASIVVRMS